MLKNKFFKLKLSAHSMAKKLKRQKIVAGNWKMNKNLQDALILAHELKVRKLAQGVQVVLCPPVLFCESVGRAIEGAASETLFLGAQNCHQEEKGAFTGEVSVEMLDSVGVKYVIVGHSERREFFKETSPMLVKKIDLLLAKNLTPIYCCGEPLRIREKGSHIRHVAKQIKDELFHLSHEHMRKIVIAYEPIWAIGTGLTASPEQAQEMHRAIRKMIQKKFGKELAESISILYGGSCNAANAATLFSLPDVDGGLIGGASLKADDFETIIGSFKN
jgi:triosephosphate isomerase (TIM)